VGSAAFEGAEVQLVKNCAGLLAASGGLGLPGGVEADGVGEIAVGC
jgi:hypothetical protein